MKPAGWGTGHLGYGRCRLHVGSTKNHKKSAAIQEAGDIITKNVVMGIPLDVDPMDALLWCVRITAGEVAYCSWRVEQLEDDEAILLPKETTVRDATGEHAESYEEVKKSNLAELNIWVKVRQNSIERLAKYSKMAIDAGVAQRQVELAEHAGEGLSLAIRTILEQLRLTADQEERAPQIVRSALRALEAAPGSAGNLLDAP